MFEPRLLRAFVILADTASFTLAAEQLHLTQSTVSQQINRLEELTGCPLFDRTQRPIKLTASGEKLLSYARKILNLQNEAQALLANPEGSTALKIGIPDDIASAELFATLASFTDQFQHVRLDVTTGMSAELKHRYQNQDFDLVVVKEPVASAEHFLTLPEPMAWYQSADRELGDSKPIPLVTFPPGGLYRDAMFDRLNHEGKPWYVVFSSSNLNNILLAVESGMGITLLPVGTTLGRQVCPYLPYAEERAMALSLYCNPGRITEELASKISTILRKRYQTILASQKPGSGAE